jgi:hypothetical protein
VFTNYITSCPYSSSIDRSAVTTHRPPAMSRVRRRSRHPVHRSPRRGPSPSLRGAHPYAPTPVCPTPCGPPARSQRTSPQPRCTVAVSARPAPRDTTKFPVKLRKPPFPHRRRRQNTRAHPSTRSTPSAAISRSIAGKPIRPNVSYPHWSSGTKHPFIGSKPVICTSCTAVLNPHKPSAAISLPIGMKPVFCTSCSDAPNHHKPSAANDLPIGSKPVIYTVTASAVHLPSLLRPAWPNPVVSFTWIQLPRGQRPRYLDPPPDPL